MYSKTVSVTGLQDSPGGQLFDMDSRTSLEGRTSLDSRMAGLSWIKGLP